MCGQNENTSTDNLIVEYLSGMLSDNELHELRTWIEASEDHKIYFLQMREVWFLSAGTNRQHIYNPKEAFDRFWKHRTHTAGKPVKTVIFQQIFKYAAAVLLLVAIAAGAYYAGNEKVRGQFADIVIEAPLGSKTKLVLPDGTSAWLNAGSKITYSQGFGLNNRNIRLTGEGYFEAAHNEKLPLSVTTDDIRVDVLGTKFNYRNYHEDQEAWVSLIEGKVRFVSLSGKNEAYNLLPNQKAVYSKETKAVNISKVTASYTAEWVNGYLFFDEELLPDITKELERSYAVKITISDPDLNNFRFYGDFERSKLSIEEIMDLLCSTNKLKYEVINKEFILKAK
jgi:ferric-dicitrate binding protein FerR (iron transport regulator)